MRVLLLIATLLPLLATCTRQTRENRRTDSTGWAARDSIKLDRADSRDAATLRFKTSKPVQCELAVWSVDGITPPTSDKPLITPCGGSGGSDYVESIPSLRPETLYAVKVNMWTAPDKSDLASFMVEESSRAGGVINGHDAESRSLDHVVLARIDLTQLAGEVHRIALERGTSLLDLRERLTPSEGCVSPAPDKTSDLSRAAGPLTTRDIASKGYASSKTFQHPTAENRGQMDIGEFNENASWEWTHTWNSVKTAFTARVPARLNDFTIDVGGTELTFSQTQGREVAPTPLPARQVIRLAWKSDGIATTARLVVRVGAAGASSSIQCVFKGSSGAAEIDAATLGDLRAGVYTVHADLEDAQIQVFPGTDRPTWVIATHDWRMGRVQKM